MAKVTRNGATKQGQVKAPFELSLDNLDQAWLEQPNLMFQAMEQLADAKVEYEQLKSQLDVVNADIAQKVRLHPMKYGHEKVTEKIVDECVTISEAYKKALAEVNEAKHLVDMSQAYVTAYDHRKKALEKLVDLHAQGYFAVPRAPDGAKQQVEELEKRFSRRRGKV
jgi:hypothetical protein